MDLTFGPVPSRRLGRSLGINNIPPKICSYACVYCQVGKTTRLQIERRPFYPVPTILNEVRKHLGQLERRHEAIDYLCFVPDGEPTLDINLGDHIDALRMLGIPIAVISNGSLIDQPAVRSALSKADWVSLKIDAVSYPVWRKINRPHRKLNLNYLLDGILAFRDEFSGTLATETMLIQGFNDTEETCRDIGRFMSGLQPDVAYLSIPTRPPAVQNIRAAAPAVLNMAFQIISEAVKRVEILSGYEGNSFATTGDVRQDILNITAVHPMREDAVRALLGKSGADWHIVDELLQTNQLIRTYYNNHVFFLRRF
jgi:wyosine [tRNA(Phe)-imidazoG37] synthetase (radical SAM superfamily)